MARVSIDLPDKFIFSTSLTVRINDVNYGGHLGNDAVLSMLHDARVQFLQSHNCSELDIGGVATIMSDVAVAYKSEGHQSDELLFEIAIGEFSNSSFDIFYKVTNQTTGKLLAVAKTGIVCYDYDEGKVKPVPDSFKKRFE